MAPKANPVTPQPEQNAPAFSFPMSAPREGWGGHPSHINLLNLELEEPEELLLRLAQGQKARTPEYFRGLHSGVSPAGIFLRLPYQPPFEENQLLKLVSAVVNDKRRVGLRTLFQYHGILFLEVSQWLGQGRMKNNPNFDLLLKFIYDLGAFWNVCLVTCNAEESALTQLKTSVSRYLPCFQLPQPPDCLYDKAAALTLRLSGEFRYQKLAVSLSTVRLLADNMTRLAQPIDDRVVENTVTDLRLAANAAGKTRVDDDFVRNYLISTGCYLSLYAGKPLLTQQTEVTYGKN